TLDGPSGAGKGTVSRAVAQKLGWHYLDSGAIYRALAVDLMHRGLESRNEPAVVDAAGRMDLEFVFNPGFSVMLSGKDISSSIQSEACGNQASRLAAMPGVRKALLEKQRGFRKPPGLVADGRDMGTVVFPDARFKFFLTASPQIRAERRVKQLKEKGMNVNLDKIITELLERDQRDENREAAPLRQADGAIFIDSSEMTIDQVVERVTHAVRGH
ncbi:MAG: (d)CMP kinase, partial [Methylococcaceae bacterium]|nr:(d)CMP kinase [Methylococcaceae bacterium]